MTAAAFPTVAYVSYGIALAAYLLFGVRVLVGWRASLRGSLLAGALIASALWAAGALLAVSVPVRAATALMNAGDVSRYAFWFAFVGALLTGRGEQAASGATSRANPFATALLAVVLLLGLLLSDGLPFASMLGAAGHRASLTVRLALPVVGLVMVEQLMRRAHEQARWSLRPLAVALAGIYGFDLVMYADAMLFGDVDADLWLARGVAHALVIPLLAVATARNTGWTVEMHVSRGAVFHSTALVASGVFLLAVSGAGYLVRFLGGDWGRALQIELLFAAFLAMLFVATSGRFRSRLRVFVSKHFFSYRYDYRKEWLSFTRTLAHEDVQRLPERTIMALASLVESPGGALWLKGERQAFVPAGRYNVSQPSVSEPGDGSLAAFLRRTGWVVNVRQYVDTPSFYAGLELPDWVAGMPDAWLIAPLPSGGDLVGFVVLTTPRVPIDIDWEVLDVIKTASRQAASYIAHARATEALLEARKFDAFNRMSAFVVHDLKNLVAQLSLMIRNAERHRDNPEFQRDMLDTVRHVVERMNGLMLQLRTGTAPVSKPHVVDLARIVERVCASKSHGDRPVELDIQEPAAAVGHTDRLEHVIGHLVQNALDASTADGKVVVSLRCEDGYAVLAVSDRGAGMTPEFVRDRLGKPFETTKTAGMGIGFYESSQYVASLGGRLEVETAPAKGTQVRVLLRMADSAALPAPELPTA